MAKLPEKKTPTAITYQYDDNSLFTIMGDQVARFLANISDATTIAVNQGHGFKDVIWEKHTPEPAAEVEIEVGKKYPLRWQGEMCEAEVTGIEQFDRAKAKFVSPAAQLQAAVMGTPPPSNQPVVGGPVTVDHLIYFKYEWVDDDDHKTYHSTEFTDAERFKQAMIDPAKKLNKVKI